jgi:hypothetical protein
MTQETITLPDFDFTGFYYPQILEALRQYGRINVPEMTSEEPEEPFIQLERAFALVGHLNNVNLDAAALESMLPTCRTREGLRNLLSLIDYPVRDAIPAAVDVLVEITKTFTTPIDLIPAGTLFSTQLLPDVGTIFFETKELYRIQPNNVMGAVFGDEVGVFADFTTQANGSLPWQPWAGAPAQNDAIYFGHSSIMFNQLAITVTVASADIFGTWEYYDGDIKDAAPNTVTNLGSNLEFDLTTLLGSVNRAGSIVRVTHLQSTAYEELFSLWDGSKNYCVTGLLGQSIPDTDPNEYAVGTEWNPLDVTTDSLTNFTQTGIIAFTLPLTLTQKWIKGMVNEFEGHFIRYRVVEVGGAPTGPTLSTVSIDNARHFASLECTQGETIRVNPLATSDGQPNQQYQLSHLNLIEGSVQAWVGAQEWGYVDNFLSSTPASKDFSLIRPEDEYPIIVFGNGVNGRIPPLSEDIVVVYRIGADKDGNVGARTVVVNSSGVAFLGQIYNPRPASGWNQKEGDTEQDRERLKIAGPADLRTRDRAVSPDDCEVLATEFIDVYGSRIVSRALGLEESLGVKTIELVCVGTGGAAVPESSKQELSDYFNGNEVSGVKGVLVINHELVVTDYQPRYVSVDAIVYGGNATQIENLLVGLLHPEALKSDGVAWEWDFGGEVPKSRIISEIFKVDGFRKVVLNTPATDITLATRELPLTSGVLITLVVEP